MTSIRSGLAAVLLPALLFLGATPAAAQAPIMQEAPQQPPQANPVCSRLEAQLQAFDSSGPDQMRAEQIRKYEAAAAQQQGQLDRLGAQAKRAGCQGTNFFSIFGGQPAACSQINNQMQQMKGNLDRIEGDLARLQGSDPAPEREGQRRALIGALAQNDCGPQYRQAAAQPPQQRGGLFESLFGPGTVVSGAATPGEFSQGAGYRTVCVRTCDGYYYPISYSTSPSKFPEDERTCQASCPTAEVMLFAHRNPGEDINQAISTTGQPYTALPNAFKYRQAFDNACSCKRSGESWSNALKGIQDPTAAPGDVVVTEDRAKQLSQPRVDAQGKPIKLEIPPRPAKPAAKPAQPAVAEPETAAGGEPATIKPDPNRTVRQVGPTFIAR